MVPGKFRPDPIDGAPTQVLLRKIFVRVRRSWLSLRWQLNRLTLGMFRRQALTKIALLLVLGYFVASSGGSEPGRLSRSIFGSGKALETTLEVSDTPNKPAARRGGGNEAAPVSSRQLTEQMTLDYIERFHKIASTEMEKYGVPASICLAQGLIESRAGNSKLAQQNNNHFGIKCFSRHCPKGHCTNFTDDTHKDFFRKYQNPWESWRAHSQMLASGRYARLKKYGRDYRQWAYGLKKLGYATDRTYAEKLIDMIERYNLQQYDRGGALSGILN
ncbi:MAG: glucosaminidase domain-containing protein [Saprospiraceae bacterium]